VYEHFDYMVTAAAAASQHKQMGWSWPFRNNASGSKLQKLLEVATLFSHQPSAEALQDVKAALREVPFRELGLHDAAVQSDMHSGQAAALRSQHAISYQHIFEDRNVSMGIFAMHRGATLPLHDHPGMHVLSRVLYGQLHVMGYDWVDRQQHTAQLAADSNLDADGVAILGPDHGGNMHRLTAVTDVAILDVLAPAYDPKGGRDCTYYAVVQDEPTKLKETQPPDDFNVVTVPYKGLRPQA
jgi:cysteamine dioxygenase